MEAKLDLEYLLNLYEGLYSVDQDSKWRSLLNIAYDGNNPIADAMVAVVYNNGAILSCPNASPSLAMLHASKAMTWLEQQQRDATCPFYIIATHFFAVFNLHGIGMTKNIHLATTLLRRNATLGFPLSQLTLATLLCDDSNTAIPVLKEAAESGLAHARTKLAQVLHGEGSNFPQNIPFAIHLLAEAANQGDIDAMSILGFMYAWDDTCVHNQPVGVTMLRRAANCGSPQARYSLGLCYHAGKGIEKNLIEGAKLFALSADDGYADAQIAIARCYFNGLGVVKDKQQGMHYLNLAAKQGNSEAKMIKNKTLATQVVIMLVIFFVVAYCVQMITF